MPRASRAGSPHKVSQSSGGGARRRARPKSRNGGASRGRGRSGCASRGRRRAAEAEGKLRAIEEEKRRAAAAEVLTLGGLARKNEEKWSEAIAAFQNCVALDANHSDAWFELGAYYGQNGMNHRGLVRAVHAVHRADPKHVGTATSATLKNARKDYDGAEKMYRAISRPGADDRWAGTVPLEEQKNDIPGAVALEEFVNLTASPAERRQRTPASPHSGPN